MVLICIWTASILIEHQINLHYSLLPDDDPKMNKTLSVFYCQLSGTVNVTLKSLLLTQRKVLTEGLEENSWEVGQNAIWNCLVFQKQPILIIKYPFWRLPASKIASLHALFSYSRVWLWGRRFWEWEKPGRVTNQLPETGGLQTGSTSLSPPFSLPSAIVAWFCFYPFSETSIYRVGNNSCLPSAVMSSELLLSATSVYPLFLLTAPGSSLPLAFAISTQFFLNLYHISGYCKVTLAGSSSFLL